MVGIIIQARANSSRLPKKMLLPFYEGKGILESIICRIKDSNINTPIIIATTDSHLDDDIVQIARKNQVNIYRGSEKNVLSRFIEAAKEKGFSKIIRVCADNPLLDLEALKKQINEFTEFDGDYWSYCKNDFTPTIKTHYGFWTEGVSYNALLKIDESTTESLYQEHVTNYIYTHPDSFKIHFEKINNEVDEASNIRLTVDTKEDFDLIKEIYAEIIEHNIPINSGSIINFVRSSKKRLQLMESEINKNSK